MKQATHKRARPRNNAATLKRERKALVKTLVEICDERGYREATPSLISQRAGLDLAVFKEHFENVEDCFLAIWDVAFEDLGEKILGAYTSQGEWRAGMRAAANELLRLLRKRSFPVARVLTLNSDLAGRRAAKRRDQFLRSFSALIDAGRYESENPELIPVETAFALTAGVHHAVYARFATGRENELSDLVPQLMCLIVTPYLGHEAGLAELELAA